MSAKSPMIAAIKLHWKLCAGFRSADLHCAGWHYRQRKRAPQCYPAGESAGSRFPAQASDACQPRGNFSGVPIWRKCWMVRICAARQQNLHIGMLPF